MARAFLKKLHKNLTQRGPRRNPIKSKFGNNNNSGKFQIVTASTQPQLKLRVTKYLVGPPHHPLQLLRHFQTS